MEIMSKVICPYCKEWLDIEKFLTLDDLKNEYTYKECYLCNKHFALRLKTAVHAKPTSIEKEIEETLRSIKFLREMRKLHPETIFITKPREEELEKLYRLQKENEKK
jgi:hypothetical protein